MTPNKRDLKAYARFDGTGRIVPGSLVLRRQKPKVGKWTEVQTYECCNQNQVPVLVLIDGPTFPLSAVGIEVGPNNGDFLQPFTVFTEGSAADLAALVVLLNNAAKNLGHFKIVGTDIYWSPNALIAEIYALNHSTELYAYIF